jgi:hypothetical protein
MKDSIGHSQLVGKLEVFLTLRNLKKSRVFVSECRMGENFQAFVWNSGGLA